MSVLIIVTWPVRRDKVEAFWGLMLSEHEIMMRLGGTSTRYFESNPNPYVQDDPEPDGEESSVLISGLYAYSSIDAWRDLEARLAEDPEFQELRETWGKQRSAILAGESTVMLHSELDPSVAANTR